AAVNAGEMLARDVDDRRIDLRQRDGSYRRMLQQLFGAAAVAAAHDQRTFWICVRHRRNVNEVFVVEELILLRRHEITGQPEQLAERTAVMHFDVLKRRAEL